MGLFGKSKNKRERKEALATLKNLERTRPTHRRMASTTDPTTAITELQPWQVGQEKAAQGLSAFAHKDVYGREITEPDLSNPTRNRWERPLETIKSFQEAIDKGYRRSYYGGEDGGVMSGPPSQAGRSFVRGAEAHADAVRADNRYAGGIPKPATPVSYHGEEHAAFGVMGGRNHLNNGPGNVANAYRAGNFNGMNGGYSDAGYGDSGYQQGSRGNSYSQPEDQVYGDANGNGVYPYNGNQNGYSQQWGPQSNGAAHPMAQQTTGGSNYQQQNGTQSNGAYPPQQQQNGTQSNGVYPPQQQQNGTQSNGGYPPQQQQEGPAKRNVIKLASTPSSQPHPEEAPKRKSWLGRRLSRGD